MVNRWAVANGNWSDTATWNGGTLPALADDVFSNNFIVQVDTSVAVNSIRNVAASGITAGGWFEAAGTADRTIRLVGGIRGDSSWLNTNANAQLLAVMMTSGTLTLDVTNQYVLGGNGAGKKCIRFYPGANCHLIIQCGYGYVGAGSAGADSHAIDISDAANGTVPRSPQITIYGGLRGGDGGAHGIHMQNSPGTPIITIYGTIYAGFGTGSCGIRIGVATPQITVIGDYITGGSASGSCGVYDQGPYSAGRNIQITCLPSPVYPDYRGGMIQGGSGQDANGVYLVDGVIRCCGLQYGGNGVPPIGGGGNGKPPMIVRDTLMPFAEEHPYDDYWPELLGATCWLTPQPACPPCVEPSLLVASEVS